MEEPAPLISLEEDGVSSFLSSLGLPYYHSQIHEHAITGEILIHLDHDALKDVGIHSVGHRLAILRAVYRRKVRENVPVEEGHWVPPGAGCAGGDDWDLILEDADAAAEAGVGQKWSERQWLNALYERDDRIRSLEQSVQQLHDSFQSIISSTSSSLTSAQPLHPQSGFYAPTLHSLHDSKPPLSTSSALSSRLRSPTSSLFPPAIPPSSTPSPQPTSTLSRTPSGSSKSRPSPTSSSYPHNGVGGGLHLHSSHLHDPDSPRSPLLDSPRPGTHPPTTTLQPRAASEREVALTPTTPTGPVSLDPSLLGATSGLREKDKGGDKDRNEKEKDVPPTITVNNNSSSTSSSTSKIQADRPSTATTTAGAEASAGNSSNNPYRSFRVTLEDPCYKVLPAALKKYKINDDWRMYALFICYGNTERCLSYDEKPLLLFQRLKESNANPVFMLRHIKDIKSPIAVASAKHALRRDKRDNRAGRGVDGVLSTSTGGKDGSVTTATRNTRLHFPPVLLPVGKDREGGTGEGEEGRDGAVVEKEKERERGKEVTGWCISIYPYLAEREDEFDVSVGDTFVIISKTKGWWVVHRDFGPSSPSSTEPRKSGWVPAGCLLETSIAPLSLIKNLPSAVVIGKEGWGENGNASNVPIEPQFVVSVSTPGVALMDYNKNGSDELDVKKGMGLRILKRYNHWSYAIKEDGQRGWIPSWFCGRASRDPTTPTLATSGANSTSSRPPHTASSTTKATAGGGTEDDVGLDVL